MSDRLAGPQIVVFGAATVGVITETNAEAAIDELKAYEAESATVLREGRLSVVPASELVPGDIVEVSGTPLVRQTRAGFRARTPGNEQHPSTAAPAQLFNNVRSSANWQRVDLERYLLLAMQVASEGSS